jgi:hypothetical protein
MTVSTFAQVNVSFLLSLELLSYQKLPDDQMLPGVDIEQSENGEKEMVFTQPLFLEFTNQTTQVSCRQKGGTCWALFHGVRGKTPPEKALSNEEPQSLTVVADCPGRGLVPRERRAIFPHMTQELRARSGAGGWETRDAP